MDYGLEKGATVFVGMSGGVDSSVSAYLLKKAGYRVVGVFIKVWHPDFLPCTWEAERLDAMRVAATLQIPFHTLDAEDTYKRQVADYFIAEYKAGRTPNPDVMCNTFVKFGHFFDFARSEGAAMIATGHYAQTLQNAERMELHEGKDAEKDQSYFLWNVSESVLSHTIFPVGSLGKREVRRIAAQARLPVATKKDSQGICFLGTVDIKEFLSHYAKLERGRVLNTLGESIGTHEGSITYTLGQRHGFSIDGVQEHREPYFVIAKDLEHNTITVAHEKPSVATRNEAILLSETNWIGTEPTPGDSFSVRTRYRQARTLATMRSMKDETMSLSLSPDAEIPTPGQSCVLYQDGRCVGGGIIQGSEHKI